VRVEILEQLLARPLPALDEPEHHRTDDDLAPSVELALLLGLGRLPSAFADDAGILGLDLPSRAAQPEARRGAPQGAARAGL
jgi:hypothetical protein